MNLILCITPLQVLIACQIIARTGAAFTGLYLPYDVTATNEAKHRYYFAKLEAACEQAAFVALNNQGIGAQLRTLTTLKTTLKHIGVWRQPIDTVYLASIDVLFLQYVVSKVRFGQLMTFDDGTANIFPNSTYFNPLPKPLPQRLFKQAVDIRYPSVPAILAVSAKHYSIFANERNIIDNVEYLTLFERQSAGGEAVSTAHKVKKILLGQGLDQFIGELGYLDLLTHSIERFGITDFVPHPRERLDLSRHAKVIHSDKIVEDYLLGELAAHPDTDYEIYTFFSTAVFTLRDFPRTRIVLLKNSALQARFEAAYGFLASRGFCIIDVDDAQAKDTPIKSGQAQSKERAR